MKRVRCVVRLVLWAIIEDDFRENYLNVVADPVVENTT